MKRIGAFILSLSLVAALILSCGVLYARYVATPTEEPSRVVLDSLDVDPQLVRDIFANLPTSRELVYRNYLRDSLAELERRKNRVFTIACVGDMVLGVNYPDNAPLLPVHDGAHLFDDVRNYLVDADIAAGNLEGLLLDRGGEVRIVHDPKYAYFFRMPERYIKHFIDAGFDFLSVANNHLRDFGEEGVRRTLDILEGSGIAYAGLQGRCETAVVERDGVRFGFAAFAPFIDMCDIYDFELVDELISRLRNEQKCDVVIVTHHGGAEGSAAYRVTRQGEFYGGVHRGNVYEFSHRCVDAGADLVFGHGPHVVRGMELYRDKLIAYSLGNFCTPYMVNIRGRNGYAPILLVELRADGTFMGGRVISARQTTRTGPKRDAEKVVIKELQAISKLDFPESNLVITDDGELSIKE